MAGWIVWLVAALALGLGETRRGGFYLTPFALGAVLAAAVSLLGVGAMLSTIVFLCTSAIVFTTLRPAARRRETLPSAIRTGATALVGRKATVIERIANYEGVGCVKIDSEVWTARSFDEEQIIDPGESVEVVEVRGATALVMR